MRPGTDIIQRLRHQTGPIHARLHDHPLMTMHVLSAIQPWSYRAFLSAFVAPWRHLQARADRLMFSTGESLQRVLPEIGEALDADLRALGPRVGAQDMMPQLTQDAQWWGLAYTLIGSGMGASVLYRQITEQWPDAPTTYLNTSRTLRVWPRLVKHLAQTSWRDQEEQLIIEGARAGFEHVASCFDDAIDPPIHALSTR